jgi:serralysin
MPLPSTSLLFADGSPQYATIFEGADAPGVNDPVSTWDDVSLDPGDSYRGSIGFAGDIDIISVELVAGQRYGISATGLTLPDTVLAVVSGNGGEVYENDDYSGLNSYVEFTAGATGTYYIAVNGYGATTYYTGSYVINVESVELPDPASEATLDELADYLTTGYWVDNGETPAAFDTRGSNVITVNLSGLDSIGIRFAEAAMEAWELVADLDFRIVTGSADITFTDNGTLSAYSTSDVSGGYITSAIVNVSSDWVRTPYVDVTGDYDDYGLQTYIHELGHALGLGHQGAYNGNATYGTDNNFTNDSWMTSVMSYFSQTDNTNVDGTYAYVMTAMSADIVAIQDLYGAAAEGSATWGNTVWGRNSNLDTYLDELFDVATGGSSSHVGDNAMTFTVYDAGGTDLIDLSTLTVDIDFDLRALQSSSIGNLSNVIHIARGTVIENLTTGSGDDRIVGNGANNVIRSGDGDDTVFGNSGSDRIITGRGNDFVAGGNGYDVIQTGNGADIVNAGNGNDAVYGGYGRDRISGGDGDDTIVGAFGDDTLLGQVGRDNIQGGDGADNIQGGNGNDRIYAGAGNDTIYGGNNNDFIMDGTGNDRIFGGRGSDTIIFTAGNDIATGGFGVDRFAFGAGDGNDHVTDFALGTDVLRLDDALWNGNLTAADVIDTYASVGDAGATIFTFGNGEVLTLTGVSDLDALEDSLVIV